MCVDRCAFSRKPTQMLIYSVQMDEELSEMGIEKFVAPALVWSNRQCTPSHRSARERERERLGQDRIQEEREFPRMRMFSFCLSNVPKTQLHITNSVHGPSSIDDFKTDEGEPIHSFRCALEGRKGGIPKMGEDVVPMI